MESSVGSGHSDRNFQNVFICALSDRYSGRTFGRCAGWISGCKVRKLDRAENKKQRLRNEQADFSCGCE